MKIVGIDLSLTSTGTCTLIEDKHTTSLIKTKKKGCSRLIHIRNEIVNILDDIDPDLVVVEGYSYGSKGHAFSIGELGGLIKEMLFSCLFNTVIVPPTCLKKFVTAKGNSGKEIMLVKTLVKYGIEFGDDNLCDAFGLAKMGKAYLKGTKIKYEQEALKGVEILS